MSTRPNSLRIQISRGKRYRSAPWRGLVEAPLLEVIDQGRIDELRRIGPTESRRPLYPRPPLWRGLLWSTRSDEDSPVPVSVSASAHSSLLTLRQSGLRPKVGCFTLNIRSYGELGKSEGQSSAAT